MMYCSTGTYIYIQRFIILSSGVPGKKRLYEYYVNTTVLLLIICVCVCVFMKLHITAQSGPVILVILCHSRWSCSTIGEGGDTTIPSPGRSQKQPVPGIGPHDPLHGRQACPELKSFHQGVGQICPR